MKKLLLTSALLSISVAPAMAQNSNYDRSLAGPYMGVYGGYGWNDVDTSSGDISVDGGDYGIYAGFKANELLDNTVNRLGLSLTGAIEIHYGLSDADENLGTASVEKDYEYGISFRPGVGFLDNVSPFDGNAYGILGYKRANFEVDGLGDETFNGFELGVGTEVVAYDDLAVRLEYAHTWYDDRDIGGVNVDNDEDTVRLGLGYAF